MQFKGELAVRLEETIAWCSNHAKAADPQGSLRSSVLRPWLLAPNRQEVVTTLQRYRTQRLRGAQLSNDGRALRSGRLLLYFPDANLSCGTAEVESHGYFDVENTPPWDTWIGLGYNDAAVSQFREFLLSWVPQDFVELVDAAVQSNPEECIQWATSPLVDTSYLASE